MRDADELLDERSYGARRVPIGEKARARKRNPKPASTHRRIVRGASTAR